jgi:hypothetical protein
MGYKKSEKKDDKVVDIVFDEQEGQWEEVAVEDEPVGFKDLADAPEPWYARLLALAFLAFALLGGLISLVFLMIATPFAVVEYFFRRPTWDASLKRWGTLFRRCMVIALTSFVGIFSVRFALSILMLYFTLYDPIPNMLGRAMGAFGKE